MSTGDGIIYYYNINDLFGTKYTIKNGLTGIVRLKFNKNETTMLSYDSASIYDIMVWYTSNFSMKYKINTIARTRVICWNQDESLMFLTDDINPYINVYIHTSSYFYLRNVSFYVSTVGCYNY